jgi:hypothetical protein
MGLFWRNNNKKVRSDLKNLFSDKRYRNNSGKLKGDDQTSKLIADLFNSLIKSKKN